MKHIKDADALAEQLGYDIFDDRGSRYAALVGYFRAKIELISQEIERLKEKPELTINDLHRTINYIERLTNEVMC